MLTVWSTPSNTTTPSTLATASIGPRGQSGRSAARTSAAPDPVARNAKSGCRPRTCGCRSRTASGMAPSPLSIGKSMENGTALSTAASKSFHDSAHRTALFGLTRPGGAGTPVRSHVPDGTTTVPHTETRTSATVAAPPSVSPNERSEEWTIAVEAESSPTCRRPSATPFADNTAPRCHRWRWIARRRCGRADASRARPSPTAGVGVHSVFAWL